MHLYSVVFAGTRKGAVTAAVLWREYYYNTVWNRYISTRELENAYRRPELQSKYATALSPGSEQRNDDAAAAAAADCVYLSL